MARVTIEDCLVNVDNRFELVVLAARRVRQLSSGEEPTVPLDRDKNTVLALREIADATIDVDELRSVSQRTLQEEEKETEEGIEEGQALLAEGSKVVGVDPAPLVSDSGPANDAEADPEAEVKAEAAQEAPEEADAAPVEPAEENEPG